MAGFGDNTTCFMRAGTIQGGIRVECGCWTQTSDATAHIPTQLTTIYAFLAQTDQTSVAGYPTEQACVSDGYIKCTMVGVPTVINYVAFGC